MSVKRIKFFNRTIKKFNKKSGHAVLAILKYYQDELGDK